MVMPIWSKLTWQAGDFHVTGIRQFQLRRATPPLPSPPPGRHRALAFFWALDGKFTGVGTLEPSNPPWWGRLNRANAPSSVGPLLQVLLTKTNFAVRAFFTWLSKGIGFGFGFGFTTPFGWLVYLLWFWFYDSQVKTALKVFTKHLIL